MKAHRYTNRKTTAQLLERLRSAPAGHVGERELAARRSIVVRLVGTLQVMVRQIAELESEIAQALWTPIPMGRSSAASSAAR